MPQRKEVAGDKRFLLVSIPFLQLSLAPGGSQQIRVLLEIDHSDWSPRGGEKRPPSLVVCLLASRKIVGVADVESVVGTTNDVRERHWDDDAIVV